VLQVITLSTTLFSQYLLCCSEIAMNIGTIYKPKTIINKPADLMTALSLPKASVDAHRHILAGFSPDIIRMISLEMQIDKITTCRWIGINPTSHCKKNKEGKTIIPAELSGKIYIFARVVNMTVKLFDGDMLAATQWLRTPARALNGESPLSMLRTPIGAEIVMDLIGQIEHGIIS
jgi:putative toxin-antitoxin system antitoxin component (TIGR02293 family)